MVELQEAKKLPPLKNIAVDFTGEACNVTAIEILLKIGDERPHPSLSFARDMTLEDVLDEVDRFLEHLEFVRDEKVASA